MDGYFFFDKDAKTIYDYTGQGLTLLSDPIERLLNYNELTDVVFANDYYNDRFFMTLKFKRINGLDGYIVAETDKVLLICKKGDSSALIRKYINEVQLKYGENFI